MDMTIHDHHKFANTTWEDHHDDVLVQPSFGSNSILNHHDEFTQDEPEEELGAIKEMMFKIAAMQPVDIDPASIWRPRRRNVRISEDPQSVAARHRRERISEKIRILQRLVPGGTKMDTASMLDEAIRYVKFLKRQIRLLQASQLPPVLPCPAVGTSYVVEGGNHNNINEDHIGAGDEYYPMCSFNSRFNIGHH
ncbi:hypothetical protein CASFOL_009155 [Castilleja foliolosa]|uniref:BHLH domain-containing protein n=1 Tax=Castilleja foliolosa TaxID=1961234 RepID=A0ABD3DXW9_9LAMI